MFSIHMFHSTLFSYNHTVGAGIGFRSTIPFLRVLESIGEVPDVDENKIHPHPPFKILKSFSAWRGPGGALADGGAHLAPYPGL